MAHGTPHFTNANEGADAILIERSGIDRYVARYLQPAQYRQGRDQPDVAGKLVAGGFIRGVIQADIVTER